MVEVEVELASGKVENQLWYANEGVTINSPLNGINVLARTHPGLQAALREDLDEYVEPAGSRLHDWEAEERFNGGWSFRKGIPVTRQRQAA